MFNWLNIELTNRCNKTCSFCGRAKARDKNELKLGDIDIELFKKIVGEYNGDILQWNKDGDALLYERLGEVADCTKRFITNIVTNGILLWDKRDVVRRFTSVCVSVTEDDQEQFENVKKFTEYCNTPVVIKFLGDYRNEEYEKLRVLTTRRSIHHPKGDFKYNGSKPVIPELGLCIDFIGKPSIDWQGRFYICNRYDPTGKGVIGDCRVNTLEEIWFGALRSMWLEHHLKGDREKVPLCEKCTFWGFPAC